MPTHTSSLRAAKQSLRKKVKAALSALSQEREQQESKIVCERFLSLPQYLNAKRISVYLSMRHEVDTEPIVLHALAHDKACYIPRWTRAHMSMVKLRSIEDYRSLPVNAWGIKEPLVDDPRDDLMEDGGPDLVVVPCLAMDANRNRLGHGKGYYDRFLQSCYALAQDQATPIPATVVLALSPQFLGSVKIPHEVFDIRPELLLTPDQTLP